MSLSIISGLIFLVCLSLYLIATHQDKKDDHKKQ